MEIITMTLVFFLFKSAKAYNTSTIEINLISILENSLENIFVDQVISVTRYLEEMNDRHFIESDVGRLLRYEEIKPKLSQNRQGRSTKKMSMAMMPLIFHVGAASTWMMLTGVMATKSVIIGIILLMFKIAFSAAKVASFFTAWKGKQHHDWSWTPPHHDFHDFSLEHHGHSDHHSYTPEWIPDQEYKTIPID